VCPKPLRFLSSSSSKREKKISLLNELENGKRGSRGKDPERTPASRFFVLVNNVDVFFWTIFSTLGILNVEMQNENRGDKLRHLVSHSKEVFESGCYDVMAKIMSLAYYLPLYFVISTEKVNPGVTCAVSSFPILNFYGDGKLVFGKYSASNVYMVQQLFDKNFGMYYNQIRIELNFENCFE